MHMLVYVFSKVDTKKLDAITLNTIYMIIQLSIGNLVTNKQGKFFFNQLIKSIGHPDDNLDCVIH